MRADGEVVGYVWRGIADKGAFSAQRRNPRGTSSACHHSRLTPVPIPPPCTTLGFALAVSCIATSELLRWSASAHQLPKRLHPLFFALALFGPRLLGRISGRGLLGKAPEHFKSQGKEGHSARQEALHSIEKGRDLSPTRGWKVPIPLCTKRWRRE